MLALPIGARQGEEGKGKGKGKIRDDGRDLFCERGVFEFDGKSGRAWERKTLNSENRGHVILPCYDSVGLRGLNGLLINPICQSAINMKFNDVD